MTITIISIQNNNNGVWRWMSASIYFIWGKFTSWLMLKSQGPFNNHIRLSVTCISDTTKEDSSTDYTSKVPKLWFWRIDNTIDTIWCIISHANSILYAKTIIRRTPALKRRQVNCSIGGLSPQTNQIKICQINFRKLPIRILKTRT